MKAAGPERADDERRGGDQEIKPVLADCLPRPISRLARVGLREENAREGRDSHQKSEDQTGRQHQFTSAS